MTQNVGGAVAVASVAVAVATNLAASAEAPNYRFIYETISDLAAGPSAWIMDSGLYALALGYIGLAVGWSVTRLPRKWALTGLLVLQAATLVVIGAFNEYAGQMNRGANIHTWAISAGAVFFGLGTFAFYGALKDRAPGWAKASAGVGVLWIIAAPLYWLWINTYYGLYERFLAVIILSWVAMAGALLFSRRAASRR